MRTRFITVSMLACLLLIFVHGSAFAEIESVNTEQVKALLEENKGNPDFVILDVSGEAGYAQGHLEGAIFFSAKDPEFESKLAQLDKDKTYLVYCQGGKGTPKAKELMEQYQFPNAFLYLEGVPAWKEAGYPLVRE